MNVKDCFKEALDRIEEHAVAAADLRWKNFELTAQLNEAQREIGRLSSEIAVLQMREKLPVFTPPPAAPLSAAE